jgi:L-asparaginase / beta-aspartyl-peptidase
MKKFAIVIHGGAGGMPFWGMNEAREKAYLNALHSALFRGFSILRKKGSAVDAVTESVIALENDPLFNAGKGSAINRDGFVEMDAAIMNGNNLRAGACSAVRGVRNPILLARKIMDHCEHLHLSGKGAVHFADEMGLPFEDEDYFITPERWEKWMVVKSQVPAAEPSEFGTAGAVALDVYGNLAAGTSTGGLTNKRSGRIGDTCQIGAGTYANNETCAISCTGEGEYIIRSLTAHEVSSLIKYRRMDLSHACKYMLMEEVNPLKAKFGLIAIDKHCNIHCVFNTPRMYRGWMTGDGEIDIRLYGNE